MSDKGRYWWVMLDAVGKEVGRYRSFDEAVRALADEPGEWAANWSRAELIKGTRTVTDLWEPAEAQS